MKRVCVKPVAPYEDEKDSQGWIVIEGQSRAWHFYDDWKRYGLWVALGNLFNG